MNRISLARRIVVMAVAGTVFCLPPAGAAGAPFSSSRITVRTEGTGPDVILIPGINSTPRTWASTVAALPGYRYHLVQVCGFGSQPAGGNRQGDVVAQAAEEIARYIRESGIGRPAVIGHSMGGTIGLMLAARHPDVLSRLMVVDIFPYMGAMFAGPNAAPAQVAAVADRIAAAMRAASPEQRTQSATATINGMVDNVAMRPVAIDDSVASDTDVSARAFHELIVTNLMPELDKIAVPVTVLYVQPKNVPIPPAQFDAYYKSAYAPVRQLTLTRIPDSAHFIMWDQPQRFQQAVTAFLGPR